MTALAWAAVGWAAGVLSLMQVEVLLTWRARRRHRRPTMHRIHPRSTLGDRWVP